MIKIISGVSQNGIIGKDGGIPWNYKDDMKHFKKMTTGHFVIMGRKTFESMGNKQLPKRNNIIVSSKCILSSDSNFEYVQINVGTLSDALYAASSDVENKDIWLIGGTSIYEEGMKYAEEIHLTLIPDVVEGEGLARFPWINPQLFELDFLGKLPSENPECQLKYAIYRKK